MSITLNGTTGIIADSPATVKANAFLDASGGNTATINGAIPAPATSPTLTTPIISGNLGAGGANYGTSGQVLASSGSGAAVSWADKTSRDTSIATTSGTAHGFPTIPTWAKKITVVLDGVSTSGTSRLLLQLGTGGSYVTTGYQSSSASVYTTDRASVTSSTIGFVHESAVAGAFRHGTFTLFNITGNTWVAALNFGDGAASTPGNVIGGGRIALSGAIDRLRITTVNGTDTFDAGTVNVFYE